jgi:hypothetical protein
MSHIIPYNKVPQNDLKSIDLRQYSNESTFKIFVNNIQFFIQGPKISFQRKVGPNEYVFSLAGTQRENKIFKSFTRHLKDAIARKIYPMSKNLYGEKLSKTTIKKMIGNCILDDKENLHVFMYDLVFKNNRDKKQKLSTIVYKINITKKDNGKEIHREERLSDLTCQNFGSTIPKGTIFEPRFLIDYVELTGNIIRIRASPHILRIVEKPKIRKRRYYYSDNEESDDYLTEDEGNGKVMEKKEIKKMQPVEKIEENKEEIPIDNDIGKEITIDKESMLSEIENNDSDSEYDLDDF